MESIPEWLETHPGVVGRFRVGKSLLTLAGAEPCRVSSFPLASMPRQPGRCGRPLRRLPSEIDQLLFPWLPIRRAGFRNRALAHELGAEGGRKSVKPATNSRLKVDGTDCHFKRSEGHLD